MTILQSLKSLSAYPIPSATLTDIAEECGLGADADLTPEMRQAAEFRRAQARVYMFLMTAPAVSQGGISFSFSAEERRDFRKAARKLLREAGESTDILGITYGYKGGDL